ncbi:RloB domain-containing protein [Nocardia aurantia]|uniref:RloB domain-containing protein n=1 Tax=Nocardia aurantia TaxID=2585199 RepID=A0A7K0DN55_9NOCA|nr:RloB domain-containing protein [Nocardia aurantia]MQY26792.1 hypothetical protein [Nocardia aurantia]
MSAKDRGKKGKRLERRTGTTPVRTTFRVYTEGVSTEPEYIDALKRRSEFADAVSVNVSIEEAGATPMRLVESACADKRRADLDVDFYWCVFDVESPKPHPHLDRAMRIGITRATCPPMTLSGFGGSSTGSAVSISTQSYI